MGLVIEVQTIPNALILGYLYPLSLSFVQQRVPCSTGIVKSVDGSRRCIVSVVKKVIEIFVYGREI